MRLYDNVVISIILACLAASCTTRHGGSTSGQDAPESTSSTGDLEQRPDTKGIPPKTQTLLGAKFDDAKLTRTAEPSAPAKPVTLDPLTDQNCRFMAMNGRTSFSMSFSKGQRSFSMMFISDQLPTTGTKISIKPTDSFASVNVYDHVLTADTASDFQTFQLSSDAPTGCDVTVTKTSGPTNEDVTSTYKGDFRIDASVSCVLSDFFAASGTKSLLSFTATVGCTGTATRPSGP
jgi:hypothetical protein